LQLTELDDLDAFYTTTLTVELDITVDTTPQLVRLLHANGLELAKYRELLRETLVDYSHLSDEPEVSGDVGWHPPFRTPLRPPRSPRTRPTHLR